MEGGIEGSITTVPLPRFKLLGGLVNKISSAVTILLVTIANNTPAKIFGELSIKL